MFCGLKGSQFLSQPRSLLHPDSLAYRKERPASEKEASPLSVYVCALVLLAKQVKQLVVLVFQIVPGIFLWEVAINGSIQATIKSTQEPTKRRSVDNYDTLQ